MTIKNKFVVIEHAIVESPVDLAISLDIPRPFREYVWRVSDRKRHGRFLVPLDGVLADNALVVAQSVFRGVELQENTVRSPSDSVRTTQAVLVPRVVSITRFPPFSLSVASTDVEQRVSIEWTLKTLDGVVVWVGTSNGKFTNNNGNAFTFKRMTAERVQCAIDDAFTNAVMIMTQSREIKEYEKSID